ncbi:MAG: serine/threonine-protein phosphatase [Parachlamydiales bacterium]|nr:serine/threonine-protein phosphatase [Parachlamydiales bacterium]
MALEIAAYGKTDVGQTRKKNEDIYKISHERLVFTIADGMGGHKAGDIAATNTVDFVDSILTKYLDPHSLSLEQRKMHIELAIKEANYKVYKLSRQNPYFSNMGTTLCVLHLNEKDAIFAHVGDSRIYQFSNNELIQLTKDHSLINKLKSEGFENLNIKKCKNIITKAIGTHEEIEPSLGSSLISKNDYFLMCTDGLSDYIDHNVIRNVFINEKFENIGESLIQLAKNSGSSDNITCVIIKIKNT